MTSISQIIRTRLQDIIRHYEPVNTIVQSIHKEGGRALLVGGTVRDLLLGLEIKDIDIEVHGVSLDQLEQILRAFGHVKLVGKAFGVLRLYGLDVDWSLPRSDSPGRKPKVSIDPFMTIKEAFARRDLTMNAMGIDLLSYELIDPFNGQQDLKDGILRAPDERLFIEDPLRFFRVMQFIGRFEMKPDYVLTNLCKTMAINTVSIERIDVEFQKLLLRSKRPSLGIRWLYEIGRLSEIMPELAATIGIPQNPQWHPEGDVFEHTMQTMDAAAVLSYRNQTIKLIGMYAAICHDLGKVTTTETKDERIISHGHAQKGVPLARRLLLRITRNKECIKAVIKLVRYHMEPAQFVVGNAKASAYKRLARNLAPEVTMEMLAHLALADRQGRNPKDTKPLSAIDPEIALFRKRAEQIKVLEQPEQPVLLGRDLLDVIEPGKKMGELLKKAYQIQLEEDITDKNELKNRVIREQ